MRRILFVCTGNICRSPMAEGLMRKLLRDRGSATDFVVESAGTLAMDGSAASSSSVDVCLERGIDLRNHVSRAVTRGMIEEADLVLTMDEGHRQRVLELCPEAEEKAFVITQYAGSHEAMGGVPDPIGLSREDYEATFQEIEASLKAALPKILALSEDGRKPTTEPAG